MPARGWDTVTVPGCVSAWFEMHAKFGKLPFKKLFEHAIEYGRKGFLVSPTIAAQWANQVPELKNQPGFANAFLPNGRPPHPGERFKFPAHAKALEEIAATKGKAFYRGKLAEKIEAAAKKQGGAMRASDLAAHKSDWGEAARDGLSRLYAARDPAQRPGHRRADGARHARALRPALAPGRRARQPAPADRGAESSPSPMRAPSLPTSTT